MFGMDLFIKSSTAGIRIVQLWMENMFKMVELFAGLSCQTKKPSKNETPTEDKAIKTTRPSPSAKEEPQVDEKTMPLSDPKPEQPSKDTHTVEETSVSFSKTAPTKDEIKTEKKPVSFRKDSPSRKKPTAVDNVLEFLARQKDGVSVEDITEATGYNRKKVLDILYKLKKRGVLTAEKGKYTPV